MRNPVNQELRKLKFAVSEFEQAKKNLSMIKKKMEGVDNSMISYHQTCKSFENFFQEKQILDDISCYYKPKSKKNRKENMKKTLIGKNSELKKAKKEYKQKINLFNTKILSKFPEIVKIKIKLTIKILDEIC